MNPATLAVSPTDSLDTLLQKLEIAIQSEEAAIQAATTHRAELVTMRDSLSKLLPSDVAPTAPATSEPLLSNGASPVQKSATAAAPAATKAKSPTKAGATPTTKQPAAKPTAKAATKKPIAKPVVPEPADTAPDVTETSANPPAKAAPTKASSPKTKAPAAAKTSATNRSSVKVFHLGRYQEVSGISKDTPLTDAIAQLLASLPDQSLATADIVRRLYGTLKTDDHAEVMPKVQVVLTAGLRQGLWRRAGRNPSKYQQLPE